ncbi:MAG TPA: ArsR family transcriptional regulator [Edaphocola sp.]|nr:ArsR family transcriptional regulator [Edaphocola sp.]
MSELLIEKKRMLVESLGIYLEMNRLVAPLAARIMATLIINGEYGTSFEQLIKDLEASKSTISTHLTNLESQQIISFYTKCGDRKRYYIMKPGYISRKINQLIEQWRAEINIHKKVLEYKLAFNKNCNTPEEMVSITFHEQSIKFLADTIEYLTQQIKEFQKIEN